MTFTSLLGSCLRFARRSAPAVLAVSLVACGSSGGGASGVAMMDANNYTSTQHDLNIPTIPVQAGTDLTLDWSGLMKNLLCHPATPILSLTFAEVNVRNKTQAQLENELAVGTFSTNEIKTYYVLYTKDTTKTAMLSSLQDSSKKNFDPTTFTAMADTMYLLAFADTININQGVQSMVFLQPDSTSNTTTVTAPDACASNVLTFMASLGTALSVPAGSYTIDWSKLTHDGFGNPISFSAIDKIEIGYYQGMKPSDLQAHFEDVEINATKLYTASQLGGVTSFDLTKTKTMDGESFTGFTGSSGSDTWAMALMCTTCPAPAPVAFTILQPM